MTYCTRAVALLLLIICSATVSLSQANLYSFSQSNGTYTPITSPTALAGGTAWDDVVQTITLPFSFNFGGTSYTSGFVNPNGYITFGTTNPGNTNYTPISSNTAYNGAISAFGRDIIANGQAITYATQGTAPNRVFVVQWNNARRYNGGSVTGDVINFQIRLAETTNVIQYVYGTCTATNTTALTVQVGLRGGSNTVYTNRTSTSSWANTTAGGASNANITTTNVILPASGLTFTWSPPAPCTGQPNTPTVQEVITVCVNNPVVITPSNVSGGTGISYQWQSSPDGGAPWTNISGATNPTYTTPNVTAIGFYRLVTTCSSSGLNSATATVSVTPNNCTPVNDICANAIPFNVNGGAVAANNSNTVTNGPEPSCGGAGIKDLWYSFVYTGGDVVIQTTLGTLTDTRLALYSACGGTQLACNDDFSGIGYASRLDVNCTLLNPNSTYYVQVGGYNATAGTFQLNITSVGASGCTNPNATNYDGCATADDGSCVFPDLNAAFTNVPSGSNCLNVQLSDISEGNVISWAWNIPGATPSTSSLENPLLVFSSPGVYPVTLTVQDSFGATDVVSQNVIVETGAIMTVDITADNLPQQTSWKVFDSSNNLVAEGTSNDATFCIGDNCHRFEIYDTGGNGICCANGNGSYRIYLNGVEVASGANFSYTDVRDVNCPQGTSCNNPITVGLGTFTAPEPNTWYEFTPAQNGQYRISTCDLATCDTKIWIYDYCNMANFDDSNEAAVTYNDDLCGVQAEMTPFLQGGQTYFIRMGDTGGACGISTIDFLIEYMGPIIGCLDPLACNFDPIAGAPGPCYYNGNPNCDNLGPDLEISLNDVFNSLTVTTVNGNDACLVNEGCLQGLGSRQILRFTTTIWNIGNQDYFIGLPNANNPQFEYDQCHNHYHYEGYAEYLLYNQAGQPMPQIGFKNGFCVLDLFCPSGFTAKYTCGNMGITAGCRDTYGSGLSCQWVDITNVPAGEYYLVVRTNWDQSPDANGRYELRYDNNWAQVCISFGRDANGNIINFTKNINACPIIEDCVGQPFGNSYPDCAGNCPGMVKRGDVLSDNLLTELDVHHYLDAAVQNANITTSTCTDLNNDGTISVADAIYLEECIHTQLDLGTSPLLLVDCDYDDEFVDQGESVEIGIHAVNLTEGYVDVYINNPSSEISALQFVIDGVVIESVENLLPTATWNPHIHWTTNGYRVAACGSVHSKMPVNFVNTPFFRIHYSSIEGTTVCISQVNEVLNGLVHNVLTNVGSCLSISSIVANFTTSGNAICNGEQVTYTDTSAGGATSWSWTFAGGTPSTSTLQNPIVTYSTPGTYSVSLTASNSTTSNGITMTNLINVGTTVTWYADADGDGFGNPNVTMSDCDIPSGYVAVSGDCNDASNAVYPGATESCNNIDDDCDTTVDEGFDLDNDGFTTCEGDCDDNNGIVYPGAFELCNGIDDDCDTTIDEGYDQDNDGFSVCQGDCNDSNNTVYPGATEICGNNIDEDCTGGLNNGCPLYTYYADADNDSYGNLNAPTTSYSTTPPAGYVTNSTDCNDSNNMIRPNATELCGNNFDDDCDGFVNEGCSTPLVVNDTRSGALILNSMMYPSCSNVSGNLLNATASPESLTEEPLGAGQDLWYHFIATTNGVRITVNSTINDMVVELQTAGGAMLAMENDNGIGQVEQLIFGNLTVGGDYYVVVRNFNTAAAGNYSICLQYLNSSAPDNGTNFSSVCNTFKCDWTGCQLYELVVVDGENTYSHTGTSTLKPFTLFPALMYGTSYQIYINSIYNLPDGDGNIHTVVVPAGPFTITFAQHPDLDLRLTDRCPAVRSMGAFISADQSLCNFTQYEWEFTHVSANDEVISIMPVYVSSGTKTRFMRVNMIPNVLAGATYRVRIRPWFGNVAGEWDTDYQLLCVAGPVSGMNDENNDTSSPNASLNGQFVDAGIYPNPSKGDMINLSIDGLETKNLNVRIIDIQGREVFSKVLNTEGSSVIQINFDKQLSDGLYQVELTFDEERIVEKLMVIK